MGISRIAVVLAGPLLLVAGAGTGLALDRLVGNRAALRTDGELHGSEAAIERGDLPPAEQVTLIRAMAEAYLDRKDWRNAIAWAQRYIKAGGAEPEVRGVLVQAYYGAADYANAARELQWELQSIERSGRIAPEDRLLLLQDCYARLNDASAYAWSLEKLLTYHPKREYWADLLDRIEKRPDIAEPLALDVARLRVATGALAAADYLGAAVRMERAGYPGEARSTVELGIARHILGNGADAPKHRQVLAQYAAQAQAQHKRLADSRIVEAALDAKDGTELFNIGYTYVTLGDPAKGLVLMEQGMRKGGLERQPQISKLRLAEAYLAAGMRPKALELFRTVGGRHGGADLGRIWAIHVQNLH